MHNWHGFPKCGGDNWLHHGLLRASIEGYEPMSMHSFFKESILLDTCLFGAHELAVLQINGDLCTARNGWKKQIECWKMISERAKGDKKVYGQYFFEGPVSFYLNAAGMLAAEAGDLLQQWMQHSWMEPFLDDPDVRAALHQAFSTTVPEWRKKVYFAIACEAPTCCGRSCSDNNMRTNMTSGRGLVLVELQFANPRGEGSACSHLR